jgi:phosphatidylserine decarboxylase
MSALTYATAQLLRVLPRATVSRAAGWLADHAWSTPLERAVVGVYSRMYDVSLDECVRKDGFTSFDDFFTRTLRDGARPIVADPRIIVSPADGRAESLGRVDEGCTYLVKGRPYRVEELVGDTAEARRYIGGGGCVIYLSPRDYHRVHSPVAGRIARVRSLPGDYYPVNAIGLDHVKNLFAINRRVAIAIDTPPESGLGRVTMVMVAAIVVGRVTVTGVEARDVPLGDHAPDVRLAKGDEVGMFHLGSTVVMFLEPSAMGEWVAKEGSIRYGEPLARAASTSVSGTNGAGGRGNG